MDSATTSARTPPAIPVYNPTHIVNPGPSQAPSAASNFTSPAPMPPKDEWKRKKQHPKAPSGKRCHQAFGTRLGCMKYNTGERTAERQDIRDTAASKIGHARDETNGDGDDIRRIHISYCGGDGVQMFHDCCPQFENTVVILVRRVGTTRTALIPIIEVKRAYSTRSCPSSSDRRRAIRPLYARNSVAIVKITTASTEPARAALPPLPRVLAGLRTKRRDEAAIEPHHRAADGTHGRDARHRDDAHQQAVSIRS